MRKFLMLGLCLFLAGCMRINEILPTEDEKGKSEEPIVEEDTEEKSAVCSNDKEEISFDAKGDELLKMEQVFYMSFEDLGIKDDMDTSQMEQKINERISSSYADINGVDAVGSIEDNRVKITVTIDYTVADIDELIEEGLLHEGEVETQYISFKETTDDYKNNGYVCEID